MLARVEFTNAFPVPNEFELTNKFGDAHACSAVWKTPNLMGILFYDPEGRMMAGDVEPRANVANRENGSVTDHEPVEV